MVLGIDIHPVYQEHIDWPNLDKNVKFIWLKVSDGGSAYRKNVDGRLYTPDAHAAGMRSLRDVAIGGYHYAQLSPSPEVQADILTKEVIRLGLTSLAPALDLEAPFTAGAAAKTFAYAFMKRLKNNGFSKVAFYSYTTMAQYIRPDLFDIPGLVTWIAYPGPVGAMGSYRGRADVHQYTASARIVGIRESTDANASLNDKLLSGGPTPELDKSKRSTDSMIITCSEPNHAGILSGGQLFDITDDPKARDYAQSAINRGIIAEILVSAETWTRMSKTSLSVQLAEHS